MFGSYFNTSAEKWLDIVNKIYYAVVFLIAFLTLISFFVGYAQYRLSKHISGEKDRALSNYQVKSQLEIAEAHKQAALAYEGASQAKERGLTLKVQLTEALRSLEQERKERIQLQAALSSRHLSPEQRVVLKDELSKISQVDFVYLMDPETLAFAQEILNTLEATGAQVKITQIGISPGFPPGVTIIIPENSFDFVLEVFHKAGIPISSHVSSGRPLTIMVGMKPVPF